MRPGAAREWLRSASQSRGWYLRRYRMLEAATVLRIREKSGAIINSERSLSNRRTPRNASPITRTVHLSPIAASESDTELGRPRLNCDGSAARRERFIAGTAD